MFVKIYKVPADGSCFYHAISIGQKLNVSFLRQLVASELRKIISKPKHPLHHFAIFYINDINLSYKSYIKHTLRSLWAGPLEAMILASALRIRIQIFTRQSLRSSGVKNIYSVHSSDAIVDVGDKLHSPLKLVIHGFNQHQHLSGCHFDALF